MKSVSSETGWVIEKNGLCFGISCGKPAWVNFPDENSVRFRRRADADLILAVLQNGNAGFDNSVVTEHLWNGAAPAESSPQAITPHCPQCQGMIFAVNGGENKVRCSQFGCGYEGGIMEFFQEGKSSGITPASAPEFDRLTSESTASPLRETPRQSRQKVVTDWCAAAFGADQAASVPQRGIRMLEEATEAAQSAGVQREMAHKLIDYVFDRPAGELAQELGGVGLTLLALAEAAGVSADAEESREIERVLNKPLEHFTKRNQVKNDAGFVAAASLASPSQPEPER